MFEVTLLLLMLLIMAACAFLPMGYGLLFSPTSHRQSDAVGHSCYFEEPIAQQNFLAYLQSEIESALWPRPTDSVLQRHYDTLVNAELENRLAAMPDS